MRKSNWLGREHPSGLLGDGKSSKVAIECPVGSSLLSNCEFDFGATLFLPRAISDFDFIGNVVTVDRELAVSLRRMQA